MPTIAEKRATFHKLHAAGSFVIPNPLDIGTTRYLQHLGFKALATTSAGFAFARGLPDAAVSRDDMLAHIAEIVAAADLPVNADFEGGYADAPEDVAESVRLCVETGVAGLSIEDSTGDKDKPLYDLDLAVARMKAARAAIDKAGGDVLLTGRAECFLVGRPDLDETVRRLKAYSAAGADCLYAPGIRTPELIAAVVKAAAPKPVNVLMPGAPRSARRAPHQRRRHDGARRLGRIHPRGEGDRERRPLRCLQGCRPARRDQWLLPRRHEDAMTAAMTGQSQAHPVTGQPVGLPVDTTPARRPGPVTLDGRYGRVERLDPKHSAALWTSVEGHDHIWTYMSAYGPLADFSTFSQWLAGRVALDDPYSYAIVDRSGEAVGIATLMEIRPAMGVIEVGHILYSPALQRTPLGTEAQYLLARYAFETLGYRRYEWKCNALNAPSRRAALRYGFAFEGVLRQHMIAKGRNRDTAFFSMLDSEWPARKAAFERWLAPENFDADGRQRASLSDLNRAHPSPN